MVHGSLSDGDLAFHAQKELAARWRLVIPNRRGYGRNPPIERVDVEVDAGDVVGLLGDGAHLLGISMGGIVAGYAALRAPHLVRSLTMIEPPAFQNAGDDPAVARVILALQHHWETADRGDVGAFLQGFVDALGIQMPFASVLPQSVIRAARNLMSEAPAQISLPTVAIGALPFPKFLISGDCSPAFESICNRLAREWGAERCVFSDAGHAVQRLGPAFNEVLERFMTGQRGH
jgi:pimeloyl-ACP methyl ester carboxylesterase